MDRVQESFMALEAAAAPPRKNGELVFEAPWESRAFGMAVALHGKGTYTWQEFTSRLAMKIASSDGGQSDYAVLPVAPGAEAVYYERWLEALESVLIEKGLMTGEELEARTREYANGVWDHDH